MAIYSNLRPLNSVAAVLALALTMAGSVAAADASLSDLQARALSSIARIDGQITVTGLLNPVRVQRDRWGVPHIYAKNQHDLFFAQGFVVAQDRLFQMELWKRSGQGRLAEILGPDAIARDTSARLLRYRGDYAAEFRSYAPDARGILEAFTSGINAYIDSLTAPGGAGLPVEFGMAGFEPEHWRPEDCLNRLAAYAMTGNGIEELRHAQAVAALGAPRATQLFDFDPRVALDPAPRQTFDGLSPVILKDIVSSDSRIELRQWPLQESNNWTVAGSLTASGKPLLANDPHRVIAEPSLRYIVHLVAPGWDVIGAGEPGLPGVAAGHNSQIAWGFTIFGLDQQDLYVEELDPRDPLRYATPNGWRRMETTIETIRVRGAAPVQVTLKFTRHGPVVWQRGTQALALRWVGSEPGTAGYLGSLTLDRALNWSQFAAAMSRWKVPSENIVYADRRGNIGEYSAGLAPIRSNWTGLLPVPGNAGYEWTGFVPTSALPHSFNPPAGFIATANQKMIPDHYPYSVGYEWASPVRYLRATELLENARVSGKKLTVADMQAYQTDVVSLHARELQRLLRNALLDPQVEPGADVRAASERLLTWDCTLGADSSAAALYEVWIDELTKAAIPILVPPEVRAVVPAVSLDHLIAALSKPAQQAFGAVPQRAVNELMFKALADARARLTQQLGPDEAHWTWGAIHTAWFRHPLDQFPGAQQLFDRGPIPRSGDGDVLQATGFEGTSFVQRSGASYREIFDLASWDQSSAINVPGQSGQPGSKHYDDLLPMWADGQYFPLAYSRRAVDAVTTDTLLLRPANRH